jgi:ribosome-dependent ATPase
MFNEEPVNTEIAIRCRDLSRKYGPVDALKPLDLDVASGSIFGFLGRNGAGKTTTMRLLNRAGPAHLRHGLDLPAHR